jgi:hypothetical protein
MKFFNLLVLLFVTLSSVFSIRQVKQKCNSLEFEGKQANAKVCASSRGRWINGKTCCIPNSKKDSKREPKFQ